MLEAFKDIDSTKSFQLYNITPKILNDNKDICSTILTFDIIRCIEFSGSSNEVIKKLENDSQIIIQWYRNNYLKPNPDEWHLLLSDVDND